MKQRIVWILLGIMVFMSSIAMAAPAGEPAPGSRIKELLAEWHKTDRTPAGGAGISGRVGLVWQPRIDDGKDMSEGAKLPGINVASPCWFRIISEDGTLGDAALSPDKDYVKNAQKRGYKVWALVSNSFDPDMTHILLHNQAACNRAVSEIVYAAKEYKLDGINLDFENMEEEDRDAFSKFVSKLGAALHKEGKTFSVDVTFPGGSPNWSLCYDRAAIAAEADYVMVMAYDEHPSGSKTSGSVASLSWVENGVQAMLREVPSDKLVLGMPLYSRIWTESDGTVSDVETLWMAQADRLVKEKKLARVWDMDAGQYYFEYKKGGRTCRVWQENARSIALKAALISRYDLAGAALWRMGFETDDVWPVLAAELENSQR
ncbi:glycosyl hydrolase family 18 protein [Schwartzia sp. (in: firmicutes)]